MNSLTFILNADWETQQSGAATFTRTLLDGFNRAGMGYDVVKMRGDDSLPPTKEIVQGEDVIPERSPTIDNVKKKKPTSIKIALGYVLELLRDCRHLWRNSKKLRGRMIVVNEFGCETIPIAARIIFPFAKIIALAHTHPGKGGYAGHPVRRFVEKMCWRSVSDIIFNSEALRDEWYAVRVKNIPVGADPCICPVIHYGIDEPDMDIPDDYPSKFTGCIDLLCASRFVRWKGHRELIDAFMGANDRLPVRMRLILVGDGPELDNCIEYAAGNENIIFLGARSDAARYFNGADIGIQLSIEPEAFGLVFLEAMSRGKPVIGTRIGGIPEVVDDGGILVEAGDVDAACAAIVKLVQNPELRKELGEKGRKRWKKKFTVERMMNDYIEYFESDSPQRTQ